MWSSISAVELTALVLGGFGSLSGLILGGLEVMRYRRPLRISVIETNVARQFGNDFLIIAEFGIVNIASATRTIADLEWGQPIEPGFRLASNLLEMSYNSDSDKDSWRIPGDVVDINIRREHHAVLPFDVPANSSIRLAWPLMVRAAASWHPSIGSPAITVELKLKNVDHGDLALATHIIVLNPAGSIVVGEAK